MAKTAVVAPYTAAFTNTLLAASAKAAARNCGGGVNGTTCGERWYTSSYDGVYGVGQQLSALEVVQALLQLRSGPNTTAVAPMTAKDVHVAVEAPSSTLSILTQTVTPTTIPMGSAEPSNTMSAGANVMIRAQESIYGLTAVAIGISLAMVFGGRWAR